MLILTPADLRRLLIHDPVTGVLIWRERGPEMFGDGGYSAERRASLWNARFAGREAGSNCNGYRRIHITPHDIMAHRVAWAMAYDRWPEGEIDHINGVRTDNRIVNLRDVSRMVNGRNMARSRRNKSGVTGVFWDARRSRGTAVIRKKYLGAFTSIDEAIAARRTAERDLGFHENHGKRMPA